MIVLAIKNLHVEDKVKKVVVVVLFWKTKMAVVTTCEYAQ